MRVVDLKVELKARGLPVSGLKAILVQRLEEHEKSLGAVGETQTAAATASAASGAASATTAAAATTPATATAAAAAVVAPVDGSNSVGGSGGGKSGVGGRAASSSSKKPSRRVSTSSANIPSNPNSSSSAAGAAAAAVYGAPTPEPRSTRSKTRRASMAAAAASVTPTSPLQEASAVGDAGSEAVVGGGAGGRGFDGPEWHIRLGAVVAFSSVAVSAACIAAGDGLTLGNLASLHVSLGALFIAGRAANKSANLWQAMLARALVTAAFAIIALEGYKQVSNAGLADHNAGMGVGVGSDVGAGAGTGGSEESAEAAAAVAAAAAGVGGVAEGLCRPGGGDGDGEGEAGGGVSCSAEAAVGWVGGVREGFEAGEWRETRLRVEEFWGWASVAGYLALVEALPVLLAPLHGLFRKLERLHNTLLALTSLAMLVGIVRATTTSGKTGSVHAMLCTPFQEDDWVFDLTSKVFFWSKMWEWFDTALLVAKGKPVTWLQYTHHASTGFLTSLNMVPTPNAAWSVVCATNSFVHAWMYGYYALPRSHPLRRTRIWLTRVQIIQHVTVVMSAVYVVNQIHNGAECYNNTTPIYAGLGLYLVYFVFFALFYRRTYGGGGEKKGVAA
ncbi:unnamed protein product [Laminaria digitata]